MWAVLVILLATKITGEGPFPHGYAKTEESAAHRPTLNSSRVNLKNRAVYILSHSQSKTFSASKNSSNSSDISPLIGNF